MIHSDSLFLTVFVLNRLGSTRFGMPSGTHVPVFISKIHKEFASYRKKPHIVVCVKHNVVCVLSSMQIGICAFQCLCRLASPPLFCIKLSFGVCVGCFVVSVILSFAHVKLSSGRLKIYHFSKLSSAPTELSSALLR